jgi:hypothetical protein
MALETEMCQQKGREGELEAVGSAKIYNVENSKFHRYVDAWVLLEK